MPDGMCVKYNVSQELDDLKFFYFGIPDLLEKVCSHEKSRIPSSYGVDACMGWEVLLVPHAGYLLHCEKGLISEYILDFLDDFCLEYEPGMLENLGPGAFYSTATTRDLTKRYGDVFRKIRDLETAICNTMARKLVESTSLIREGVYAAAMVDCLSSFADFAESFSLVRPALCDDHSLNVQSGFHIINKHHMKTNNYIPNDTHLGSSKRRIHVITGPNASGKTSYIEQVASIVYLAHIGSFVPAKVCLLVLFN